MKNINIQNIIILILIILILLILYKHYCNRKLKHNNIRKKNIEQFFFKNSDKFNKSKILICLFGVIPRSIKYTWSSINNNIIDVLKKRYDVEIFVFNMNVGNTKVDDVYLNQSDIQIIPYNYKEEIMQNKYNIELEKICNQIECKLSVPTIGNLQIKNAIRQMYSEYRVGKFLKKNKNKYKGAIVIGPDYYIVNKLNLNEFNDSIYNNEKHIYTTFVGDWGGYTNGLYFGKIKNLLPILYRYKNLNKYLPTDNNYEYILKKSFINNEIIRKKSLLLFFKIRANKKVKWFGTEEDKNKIKNRQEIEYKLKLLSNQLENK